MLHVGNARTALFNFLLARRDRGQFILRSEDTDRERSREEYLTALCEDLRWLELDWDAGPDTDPQFRQSERADIYQRYYEQLEAEGLTFPCFCTAAELKLVRRQQLAAGRPPRYPGTCRELSESERAERLRAGTPASLRFRVPGRRWVEFVDMVRGEQSFRTDDIGDFVIRRSDGTAAFFFGNAVDDALMGVTHVLRGEDHLANTPRQIMILQALGLPVPEYGHLALLFGSEGTPLSKRHGSAGLRDLRQSGFLPGALLNYLARLGHTYTEDGYLDLPEMIGSFSIQRLGRSPARFDDTQLLHWQRVAVNALDQPSFFRWLGDAVPASLDEDTRRLFVELVRPNVLFPRDAQDWAAILFDIGNLSVAHETAPDPEFLENALEAYERGGPEIGSIARHLQETLGVKGKSLYQPLRQALTGRSDGPELGPLLRLMPADVVRSRLTPKTR